MHTGMISKARLTPSANKSTPSQTVSRHANANMHHQMCSLRTNVAAHPYSVSDLIDYPMPRPYARGHRGRLRLEAASSRTEDDRLIPTWEDYVSKQARPADGSNATPALPPKSKINRAAPCEQRQPQRQTESQLQAFDAFWRQNSSWG